MSTATQAKTRAVKRAPSKTETLLALKTVSKDMRAYGGFVWPKRGSVEAPDWDQRPVCGGGLHALGWGIGSGGLLNWEEDARWLIVEVDQKKGVVDLEGKIKFRAGKVIHCGDRKSATDFLFKHKAGLQGVVGAFVVASDHESATAGDYGTATAGDYGTATAGYRGTATAGDYGTATAGYRGTATAGDYGTATAGEGGTATAGEGGSLIIRWWDGSRYRFSVAYINENGVEPNVKYRLTDKGVFIKAD